MPVGNRRGSALAWGLAGCGLVVGGLILLSPTPVDAAFGDRLQDLLGWLRAHGAPRLLRYGVIEFAGNILLFIPAGLFLAWRMRNAAAALAIAVALSGLMELAQGTLLASRSASLRDILGNSLGALAGILLYHLLARLRRTQRERLAQLRRPE